VLYLNIKGTRRIIQLRLQLAATPSLGSLGSSGFQDLRTAHVLHVRALGSRHITNGLYINDT